MKIDRTNLITALEAVKPGLASQEMIEQSKCFAFTGDHVVTYNDEISIAHPIDIGFKGAVDATRLYQLLNRMKRKEIDLTVSESELQIKAGRLSAGITLQETVTLPLDELGESKREWTPLPKDFCTAVEFVLFSCSKDMSTPLLTCVHVNAACVESSDNYRLTRYDLSSAVEIPPFLLPAVSAKELIKYPITHVDSGEGWIHFKTKEGTIFSCRIFQDSYVDTSEFWAISGDEIIFPRQTQQLLERAGVFSAQDHFVDEHVWITFESSKMSVQAKGTFGWLHEECRSDYEGEPIKFIVNPTFLKTICALSPSCIVSKDRVKFVGENWEHVLSLVSE